MGSKGIGASKFGARKLMALIAVSCPLLVIYFDASLMRILMGDNMAAGYDYASQPQPSKNADKEVVGTTKAKPKFAIMSSFVPNRGANPPPRLKEEYFEHIVNKACYCYIWGYDFIFNTTYAFDDTYPKWHWLNYGTWHRVPHIESRIRDYDWIFYTDTDIAIKDMMRPLESFVHEFELYGKKNVQLFVPIDYDNKDVFTFSAFALMIHNSPFGRSILKHWDDFARGTCIKGNLNKTANGKYNWLDTDQPGLWYAMMRTYADFFPDRVPEDNYPQCNSTTGVLNSHVPPWNDFFKAMTNLTKGSTGLGLSNVPDDQPFLWSSLPDGQRSGLAMQLNWGKKPSAWNQNLAFALHQKQVSEFPYQMVTEIEKCRKNYGCYAHYNNNSELKIGCGDKVYL